MTITTLAVSDDEDGMRLDRWFKHRVPDLALSHLNKICRKGEVRVDGKRVETSTRLKAGQQIRIPPLQPPRLALETAPEETVSAPPSRDDQRLLRDMTVFEDAHVLVLNKPYGLAVQGGSGQRRHVDGMLASLTDARGERPRLVHRLDRDTSGVLLVAKTRRIAADLGEIFRSRQARKIYWALVEGVPRPAQGRISLFLAKGEGMGEQRAQARQSAAVRAEASPARGLERMRVARHGEVDAQHSVTYYTIVDKISPRLAWLSMKPITGRTHQLRAHAEAIGHPIIGDPKYTGARVNDPRRSDPLRAVPPGIEHKLHLLARRLILPHPKGGSIDVTAPLPDHMRASFEMVGFDVHRYDPIDTAPEE
jgi:23S rRNA pseudouridine955/2504/2580 synthase